MAWSRLCPVSGVLDSMRLHSTSRERQRRHSAVEDRRETCYTAIRHLRCRMTVLYGYWQQLYGTVRCYTASGRTIISPASL